MKQSWRDELCGFKLTMSDLDTAVSKETINLFKEIMKKAMNNETLSQEEYRVIVDTIITITITQESPSVLGLSSS
jgi:Na+-translocating ferredoxin:NAD+ oxidoreductase RnfG subunit